MFGDTETPACGGLAEVGMANEGAVCESADVIEA